MDSAKAAAEADRIASVAGQNFNEVRLSLRNCLQVVHKTRRMLEVDPECTCVNSNNDGESKWKRRRELEETADSIEFVLRYSLTEIETKLPESDDDMLVVQPKLKRPAIVGDDDNLLWCDRVCVYEKVMDNVVWCTTPPTIMELVFARLPLDRIFEMRGLSKQWRALSCHHPFNMLSARLPQAGVPLYLD